MILGLAGQAGAGKDFTYQWLNHMFIQEKLVAVRVAFADGVREEIEDVLQIDSEVLWTKPYPEEIRRLLQWWGTEYRRAEDPDYWSKKGIAEAIRVDADPVHLVVITDVRFANEAKAIKDEGGMVYEVIATTATRQARLGGLMPPAHASEEIDFEVDGYIQNHGGPPEIPDELWSFITEGTGGYNAE